MMKYKCPIDLRPADNCARETPEKCLSCQLGKNNEHEIYQREGGTILANQWDDYQEALLENVMLSLRSL